MKPPVSRTPAACYQALFEALPGRLPATQPAWLEQRRKAAFDQLQANGFPTRRVEEWKYTDISALAERAFTLTDPAADTAAPPGQLPTADPDDLNVVFVNGIFAPAFSAAAVAAGVRIIRLHDLTDAVDADIGPATLPSTLLNLAFRRDGVRIEIDDRQRIDQRIHVLFLHAGDTAEALLAPYLEIAAGELSEAGFAITSRSDSTQSCLQVPLVTISAAAGAQLGISQVQNLNARSWQLGTTRIVQQRDSRVTHLEAALGAALGRHDLTALIDGPGAEVELDGLYALRDRQHTDFHTTITHAKPDARSRQVYKGILDDHACAVFNGAVKVSFGASGTDGYQLNRALLLSRDAQVNSKPELQIDNDDVRCSHGATIGQLDPQELFYLQSRGIPEALARDMLARAFVEDILFRQKDARQRRDLDALLDRYFEKRHARTDEDTGTP